MLEGRPGGEDDAPGDEPEREGHQGDKQVVFDAELLVVVDADGGQQDQLQADQPEDEQVGERIGRGGVDVGGAFGEEVRAERGADPGETGDGRHADGANVLAPIAHRLGGHTVDSVSGVKKPFALLESQLIITTLRRRDQY